MPDQLPQAPDLSGFRPRSGKVWMEADLRRQAEPRSEAWGSREEGRLLFTPTSPCRVKAHGEGRGEGPKETARAVTISRWLRVSGTCRQQTCGRLQVAQNGRLEKEVMCESTLELRSV